MYDLAHTYDAAKHALPPSIATYNLRSLSAYARLPSAMRRQRLMLHSINASIKSYDIICLQETHLNPNGPCFLKHHVPNCTVFTSSVSERSAGVAILVANNLLTHYECSSLQHILDAELAGHTLAVLLKSRDATHGDFLVQNLYLDSTTDMDIKTRQLKLIRRALPSIYTNFVVGDFNFIEDPDDTTTYTSHYHHTPEFAREWGKYCSHFDLTEIPQHAHTYYYRAVQNTLRRSSRLDRIYTSLPETDYALVGPTALIASIPNGLWAHRDHTDPTAPLVLRSGEGSDHAPVGLRYNPHRPDHAPSVHYPTVPRWLAEDPEFKAAFMESWSAIQCLPSNPYARLLLLKKHARRACLTVKRARRHACIEESDALLEISLGLKILALARDGRLDATLQQQYARRYKFIAAISTPLTDALGLDDPSFAICLADLRALLERRFSKCAANGRPDDNQPPPAHGPDLRDPIPAAPATDPSPPATTKRKSAPTSGRLAKIKALLPSTRTVLPGLRRDLDEAITTDPEEVATIASEYWGKIWAKRRRRLGATPESYCRPIDIDYNEETTPLLPTLRQLKTAIAASKNSCAARRTRRHLLRRLPRAHRRLRPHRSGRPPPPGLR